MESLRQKGIERLTGKLTEDCYADYNDLLLVTGEIDFHIVNKSFSLEHLTTCFKTLATGLCTKSSMRKAMQKSFSSQS